MIAGIGTVCGLQALWPLGIPWALGLTAGAVALVANLAAYLALALVPHSAAERERLDALFSETERRDAASTDGIIVSA